MVNLTVSPNATSSVPAVFFALILNPLSPKAFNCSSVAARFDVAKLGSVKLVLVKPVTVPVPPFIVTVLVPLVTAIFPEPTVVLTLEPPSVTIKPALLTVVLPVLTLPVVPKSRFLFKL